MSLSKWRNKTWMNRFIFFATVIVILSIASHPELRLLVPVIDVLGLDVFILVIGFQSWSVVRPAAVWVCNRAVMPMCSAFYRALLFMFGYMGPYVEARIACRQLEYRV